MNRLRNVRMNRLRNVRMNRVRNVRMNRVRRPRIGSPRRPRIGSPRPPRIGSPRRPRIGSPRHPRIGSPRRPRNVRAQAGTPDPAPARHPHRGWPGRRPEPARCGDPGAQGWPGARRNLPVQTAGPGPPTCLPPSPGSGRFSDPVAHRAGPLQADPAMGDHRRAAGSRTTRQLRLYRRPVGVALWSLGGSRRGSARRCSRKDQAGSPSHLHRSRRGSGLDRRSEVRH
jgi:hypothetical protein